MASALPDLAMMEDQNLFGMQDGAQPMRHHDAGSARHQLGDRALDLRLRLRIDRAGGLVEHQDLRIQRERAREAQELSLAHAQASAPLAEHVAVPGGQPLDEPVGAHAPRRFPARLRRHRSIEREIVQDVSREEEEILLHEADDRPEVGRRKLPDVHAVHRDPAAVGVVEPEEQIDDRRLSRPGVPHEGDRLARARR